MMLHLRLSVQQKSQSLNIANSEQSSQNPVVAIEGNNSLFIGKKEKNGQIKGLISNMWLTFYAQYNLSYLMFVQIKKTKSSSSREIFDINSHIHYIGVRDRTGK